MSNKLYYVMGITLISLSVFSSCDFESKKEKSNKLCIKALSEYEAKDYKQSLADYKMAITLDSTNGNAFEGKGSDEYHLNNKDSALQDEFTALRLSPDLKNVRNWIGLIKLDMGDFRGSLEYYNKSIELGGSSKDYVGRGAAEYHLGEYDKAIQDETKALQIDTEVENACFWRAQVKEAMGDYQGAIDDHLKSLSTSIDKGSEYQALATDEDYLKDYDKALEHINLAIATDTTLKNSYNWRGRIKQDMKDYSGSEADYTTSIKLGNSKGKDYEGRAVDEYYLKDYSNALNDINMAMQSDSTLKMAAAWKTNIEKAMGKH